MLHETKRYDLVVVGGGMAGVAAALSAARRGLRTALVHDRPVLGGSAGKEIRAPLNGAGTGENNRLSRETGLVEELRLENLYRNPRGNAELWDLVLLEAVLTQESLDCYLNTVVTEVRQDAPGAIAAVIGYTLASERRWTLEAPFFADCTGDGTVGALAGAEYRIGREAQSDFGESLAPKAAAPVTLGATLLVAAKDAGYPVPFVAPKWAYSFTEEEVRFRHAPAEGAGPQLFWVEWSGELDPIHDSEQIKFELLRTAYGVFDHLKNAATHRVANANLTLEWVGSVPAKRESRRFLGDYILTQQDLLEPPEHDDAVAVGGASLRHHTAGAFLSAEQSGCRFHVPGVYNIPFRCLYSRNIRNLFFAGRAVSASHVAACSAAALASGAQAGEAIGAAAAHCLERDVMPEELVESGGVYTLQQDLLRHDHYIAGLRNEDPRDLARTAEIVESSASDTVLENPEGSAPLDRPRALMLPLAGRLDSISLLLHSAVPGEAEVGYAVHGPDPRGNFLPGPLLGEGTVRVSPANEAQWVDFAFAPGDAEAGFHWLIVQSAPGLSLATTRERLVGVLSYAHAEDWQPDPGPWTFDRPERNPFSPWRVLPENYCFRTDAWMPAFYAGEQVANGFSRARCTPNIWVSVPTDFAAPEWLEFRWPEPRDLASISLYFNTDLDRELPNLWFEHPFRAIPECIRDYRLLCAENGGWRVLLEERGNYQRFRTHAFPPVTTDCLRLEVLATHGDPRAQIYEVRIYGPAT